MYYVYDVYGITVRLGFSSQISEGIQTSDLWSNTELGFSSDHIFIIK